ncbi:OsmC family protein [Streptomyces sp. Rer75]|uniref:OsmC family protein n=1 Tax=unclassified Streptomyces TaxID=2593676 RepID=UPI0027B9AE6E|nr:hypothetical protein [Streptomyces sp. Rer75]
MVASRHARPAFGITGDSPEQWNPEAGHSGRFTEVVLRPVVTVADAAMLERARSAHGDAHRTCFIANSVNFPVRHEPTVSVG